MRSSDCRRIIDRVCAAPAPRRADLEDLLALESRADLAALFAGADRVRKEFVGDGILVRGIIEFSNYCRNTCAYCGLNRSNNRLHRYRLSKDEIMAAVNDICRAGIKTVVLQSGEDNGLDPLWLRDVIAAIKAAGDLAVTLSVGERAPGEYELWKKAGADRYLLKIETTDPGLYRSLHPQMSLANRMRCSRFLKAAGYQNGSGSLVGLPGQSLRSIADDIRFFKKEDFDMIGIGLFIPHDQTSLRNEPAGDLELVRKVIALTRIVTRNAHMPATTAVETAGGMPATIKALKAGANVIMFNFTPAPFRNYYEIYPGRRCFGKTQRDALKALEKSALRIGRFVDYSAGHTLKKHNASNNKLVS